MHNVEDDIEYTKTGIKTPRLQALPTMNLPLKSHEDTKVERKLLQQRQMMLKERKYLCTKILVSCIKEYRSVIGLQRNGTLLMEIMQ